MAAHTLSERALCTSFLTSLSRAANNKSSTSSIVSRRSLVCKGTHLKTTVSGKMMDCRVLEVTSSPGLPSTQVVVLRNTGCRKERLGRVVVRATEGLTPEDDSKSQKVVDTDEGRNPPVLTIVAGVFILCLFAFVAISIVRGILSLFISI